MLEGAGLVLRDWRDDDAPAFEAVCGDPDVCRFTSVPWVYSRSEVLKWIARARESREAGRGIALAIARPETSASLGNVNLVRFGDEGRTAALGYWVIPPARREGLAVSASRLLCNWAFAELNLTSIELAILPDNIASHGVARSLGATNKGLRRDSHEADGRMWDMVIYTLRPTS
jgi:RimJ/RimL family protein N-acetyltransferase